MVATISEKSRSFVEGLRESEAVFTALAPPLCILIGIGFALWAAAATSRDAISQATYDRRARMAKIPPG
jgi:hypothetical protein